MTAQNKKKISKFLSLVLRHRPEKIGLILDDNGWANVSDILDKSTMRFSFDELSDIVATNDKKRFSFNEDKTKIRANQGHSLKEVDLNLKPQAPPLFLYHGTVAKFMPAIKSSGLKKMSRQHVHLSKDIDTAANVGSRRGKPIILCIRALEMHNNKYQFFMSENGVWLTDEVPVKYVIFKD